ncbi:MAG: sulfotransferase family protein, partial [Bacteroidota bacterium]
YFETHNITCIVLDSKKVLLNPEATLKKLCEAIEIPFDEAMLSWQPQEREEDGIWAKYWYKNVHLSEGFSPYKPKTEPFPEHLIPLLNESEPYYQRLVEQSL